MKKLPIKFDTIITSECWTHSKMAIIEASPHRQAWLASHMELYVTSDFCADFGYDYRTYQLKYYEDILSFHEIPLSQVNSENIVQRIINEIKNGYYIVIGFNYPMLFLKDYSDLYINEAFLYGFDEEKEVFFCSKLQESKKFAETEIPFSNLIKSFNSTYSYYKNNPQIMIKRRQFSYSIMKIKLRDDYCEDNNIYLTFRKIENEYYGYKGLYSYFDENIKIYSNRDYYTGIACLLLIQSDIQKFCSGSYFPTDVFEMFPKALKKLHEQRSIILLSMKWLIEKLAIYDSNIINLIDIYKSCCDIMNNLYLMGCKFNVTQDVSILKRIDNKLSEQYRLEYLTLQNFIDSAKEYYYLNQQLK